MKNTTALVMILLGGILIYGGYKDWSFADTIRFFTGQKLLGTGGLKSEGDLKGKGVFPQPGSGESGPTGPSGPAK